MALAVPCSGGSGQSFLRDVCTLKPNYGVAITISEQTALNVDTSNLLIAMPVLAAAGALGGFFPPLVMGAAYDAAANSYFNGQMLLSVTVAARGG